MAPMDIDRPVRANHNNTGPQVVGKYHRHRRPLRKGRLGPGRRNGLTGKLANNPQQLQGQRQIRALHCDNCPGLSNHDTKDCRRNRRQLDNANNNDATPNQAHNTPDPQVASVPYCPACNAIGHHEYQCNDSNSLVRYAASPVRCMLCGTRGHAKDQCNNPSTTKCRHCCRPGHSANDCRSRGFCRTYRSPPSQRSQFQLPGCDFNQGLQFSAPGLESSAPGQRPRTRSLAMTDANSPSSITHHPESAGMYEYLRKRSKIDSSASMYSKHCADHYFRIYEPDLVKVFDMKILLKVKDILAVGWHFFRDPQAMSALFLHQKPVCSACGKDGVILDQYFSLFPQDVDILNVYDGEKWGVFVYFQCNCSAHGFHYVPDQRK